MTEDGFDVLFAELAAKPFSHGVTYLVRKPSVCIAPFPQFLFLLDRQWHRGRALAGVVDSSIAALPVAKLFDAQGRVRERAIAGVRDSSTA
jgi:hypothetical protein